MLTAFLAILFGLALGNILGSNLFNTLAVVGIADSVAPMNPAPEVLTRDIAVMAALTLILFVFGYGWRKAGRPVARVTAIDAPTAGKTQRLGFMKGYLSVPDDFDQMAEDTITELFGGPQ